MQIKIFFFSLSPPCIHLTCFKCKTLCLDSPMDMSVVEGEDKPVTVNEVPEYAAEIHAYLREMEVTFDLMMPERGCPWCHFTDVCLLNSLVTAENQTKSWLHEKAARHHSQYESHPGGLAGGGWRRVQASKRDSLSGCELHWSLPLLDVSPEGQASASWNCCHAAGFVRLNLLFTFVFQACSA